MLRTPNRVLKLFVGPVDQLGASFSLNTALVRVPVLELTLPGGPDLTFGGVRRQAEQIERIGPVVTSCQLRRTLVAGSGRQAGPEFAGQGHHAMCKALKDSIKRRWLLDVPPLATSHLGKPGV